MPVKLAFALCVIQIPISQTVATTRSRKRRPPIYINERNIIAHLRQRVNDLHRDVVARRLKREVRGDSQTTSGRAFNFVSFLRRLFAAQPKPAATPTKPAMPLLVRSDSSENERLAGSNLGPRTAPPAHELERRKMYERMAQHQRLIEVEDNQSRH